MKNILNYYYDLSLLNVYEMNDKYYFSIDLGNFVFLSLDIPIDDLKSIYNLYTEIKKKNLFVNDIILNKDKQVFTIINNIPYVLIKDNCKKTTININDILYVQNNSLNLIYDIKLFKNNWVGMWKIKIDYYEKTVISFKHKYPLLYKTMDYYIGLGENAISFLVNNDINIKNYVLSHKRICNDYSAFDFYNPISFIVDSRVRDFSEYFKNLFFENNLSIDAFHNHLNYINFSKDEYILLFARLLFPTYYFDLYDEIVNNKLSEDKIKNVLNKNNDYILFLKNTFYYVIYVKKINIPYIEWIFRYPNL